MDGQQNGFREMEENFASFAIEEEEQGGLSYMEDSTELSEIDTKWCLVGKFLTDSTIDFQAMQHKMASLWRPGKGMYVKQLDSNRFLFQFYHEIDIKRVCDGSPWTFGRFHLVFERLTDGVDPRMMVINNLELWVQLHGIGSGFMSQRVVTDIGNHIGKFVESDVNNFVGVWRDYFRVRVSISLDAPLKRRMKLRKNASEWCWVNFKYEAVPTFCFICGIICHTDKFCAKLFEVQGEEIEKPYGTWMRADPKRKSHTMGSKWLRPGGAIPANKVGGEASDKSNTVIIATECKNDGNKIENMAVSQPIEFENNNDTNEIIVTDPKRRRVAHDARSQTENIINNPEEKEMTDNVQEGNQNQKNVYLAGTALQARQSS